MSESRKPRTKRESIIQTRSDEKRSAHIQGRFNEATVAAHSDILDMLHNLYDIQKKSQQDILDAAFQALYTSLTNGERVGERLRNESVTGELIALIKQATDIQAYALSILDKIENGTFAVGDVSETRNQIHAKGTALRQTGETLGLRTLPDAGTYAGEISFSDDDED
jgi:hypothetical protein